MQLVEKKCIPCESDASPITGDLMEEYSQELGGNWKVINEHHLEKEFTFKDFKEAQIFSNKVGQLAEKEGHHPHIHLSYGHVRILLWTHVINGLSENDFILAAKIDKIK